MKILRGACLTLFALFMQSAPGIFGSEINNSTEFKSRKLYCISFDLNKQTKYGYVDKSGSIVIPPQYDCAFSFREGMAGIRSNNKIGFINSSGDIVIRPQFEDDWNPYFSEGLARIKTNNKCGYIDKNGTIVIKPQYDDAENFSEGLAKVVVGGKAGFINRKGQIVIKPTFIYASSFSEGLARVTMKNRKSGFINSTGKIIVAPIYDVAGNFSEGLASVQIKGKYGFIDRKGNLVIPANYIVAQDFSEGLAAVSINKNWGFIDHSGKVVIPPGRFGRFVGRFSEGLVAVTTGEKYVEKWGYINKAGEIVIKPIFDKADDFSQGHALVQSGDNWGIIDKSGTISMVKKPDSNAMNEDCGERSNAIHHSCKSIKYNDLPEGIKILMNRKKCDVTTGSNYDYGYAVDLNTDGKPEYAFCCEESPHGPCGMAIFGEVAGQWRVLFDYMYGFSDDKTPCFGFTVLNKMHEGYNDVCLKDGVRGVIQFNNGKYVDTR